MSTDNSVQFLPEWAPQSGVMLTWPHAHSDWQPFLKQVEPVFCDIAFHVSLQEQVLICCWDQAHSEHVSNCLKERGLDLAQVRLQIAPSNDTWARDHGPITVLKQGQALLLDFTFNGWGNKYDAKLDNAITRHLYSLSAFGDAAFESIDMVMEGGSLESDGLGTLLTTSRCLLSPQRNPSLDREQIAQRLQLLLGIERILWLEQGHLAGDDTDSHIDTLARFCSPDTICYVSCDDPEDEHFEALQAMATELQQFRQTNGEPYKLIALPMTNPILNEDGVRLPATYANFLIINNAVLVPTYEDEHDALALQRLGECFPEREIIAINCKPLIEQYGSLHCVTMQLPQGVLA
jgi:agmatine deiminase